MPSDWLGIGILVVAVGVSGYYRHRARRLTGTLPRRSEGIPVLLLRLVAAGFFVLIVLAHAIAPGLMTWATLPLPAWVRWGGAVLEMLAVASVHWVLRSLGPNVSETVLTKERHELVTRGPYRWIRHPLYTTGILLMAAIGLVLMSWVVLLMALVAALIVHRLVIPPEERALLERFPVDYAAYMRGTGRWLPRLRR